MTAHDCVEYNPACYRCDLNTDEMKSALADIENEIVDLQMQAAELAAAIQRRER